MGYITKKMGGNAVGLCHIFLWSFAWIQWTPRFAGSTAKFLGGQPTSEFPTKENNKKRKNTISKKGNVIEKFVS